MVLILSSRYFTVRFCVEVLRPSQPNQVMSSTVSLPNHTFTGQALSSKRLTSIVHILSPETDNCPSWISGRERMTVRNISWSISTKECCRPRRGWTRDLLVSCRTAHPTEPLRPAILLYTYTVYAHANYSYKIIKKLTRESHNHRTWPTNGIKRNCKRTMKDSRLVVTTAKRTAPTKHRNEIKQDKHENRQAANSHKA